MRQLRLLLLAFFAVVAVIFTITFVHDHLTSDDKPPVIQAETDTLEVPLSATDEELLAGLTAQDNLDGDVTDTLVVVSRSKLIGKGTIRVYYAAFDKNNNVGTYSRDVTFADYVSPRFHLAQPLRFPNGSSDYNFLENVTAEDCLDGDITRQVKISTGSKRPLSDAISEQTVNLQVTNSVGDTSELELAARLEDFTSYNRPVPALREYVVYVSRGGSLNLRSLLSGIWAGGKTKAFSDTQYEADNVYIRDEGLDLNTPGVYTVNFELYDYFDQYDSEYYDYLGGTTLVVIVEE